MSESKHTPNVCGECERLKAVNAELMAACELAMTLPLVDVLGLAGGPYVARILAAAIAKATGQ